MKLVVMFSFVSLGRGLLFVLAGFWPTRLRAMMAAIAAPPVMMIGVR